MPDPQVLVVDDEAPIRELLVRWLTGWGYTVKAAASADEALALMTAEPAAILVCDIEMPGHDGLWLTGRVLEQWPDTTIIMGTVHDDPRIVRSSRTLGALWYVTKPFDPILLRQAVDHAAGRLRFRPSAER